MLGDRLRDELGSSTFPQFITRLNIRNAEIHKAVDVIRVGDAERYRRLIRGRPAPNVQNHPDIRKLKVPIVLVPTVLWPFTSSGTLVEGAKTRAVLFPLQFTATKGELAKNDRIASA
jgi:hypothetical protein